jgi:membrane protein implicated in regulation of membrane protease activity
MLNPALLWLIFGSVLCLMELVFPTAFVAFMMGVSAIIVAGLALLIPQTNILIFIWMIGSILLITSTKKYLMPKRTISTLQDSAEGETLTEIGFGKPGRVLYEGNSWRAICEDETITIASNEKVYIVGRKGNTLLVLPVRMLKS